MSDAPKQEQLLSEISELSTRIFELKRRLSESQAGEDDAPTFVESTGSDGADEPVARHAATVIEGGGGPPTATRIVSTQGLGEQPTSIGGNTFERRYTPGAQLGLGGMGEVRLYTDRRVGREVAMKVLLPRAAKSKRLRERFLFEARVQGQLEHPSIVPVYDIGERPDGSTFFTMKRVNGVTLQEVLNDLRQGSKTTERVFTRRRLLLAFQSLCQAVELAHQRGVVHRDLKPANIIFGEFGEVSLLDWGVAKLAHDPEVSPLPAAAAALEEAHAATAIGEVLGTPGYMSPEQATGEAGITAQSDVFSLGAILFELLTLKKLIPRNGDPVEDTILRRYDARATELFPEREIAPALGELCVQATQHDPAQRTRTARDMYELIERTLEGEGEEKRRRTMSRRLSRAALTSLVDAEHPLESQTDPTQARAEAMQNVTQALALDPENRSALDTLVKLIAQVPKELSPAAEENLLRVEEAALRDSARRGAIAYLAVAGNLMLAVFLGVTNWAAMTTICALLVLSSVIALVTSRLQRPRPLFAVPVLVLTMAAFSVTAGLFGPFTLSPLLCSVNAAIIAVALDRRLRWISAALGVLAILGPLFAQSFGLIPALWEVRDGALVILPHVVAFQTLPTVLFLGLVMAGVVVVPVLLVGAERDARAAAERRLALHLHQMTEVLPPKAKDQVMSSSVTESRPRTS